ncbi:MAG: hypothetical protein U0869_04780 [Chloroflexota bacterium]
MPDDEFTSTLFPLLAVAERRGVTVRQVPLERLVDAIVPGVTSVAASLVQMQTGRTLDLVVVADAAERVGARLLLIDGTQGIPFVPPRASSTGSTSSAPGKYLLCAACRSSSCARTVGASWSP